MTNEVTEHPRAKAKYLWMDLETAGLDPTRRQILEMAVIVTDDELGRIEAFSMPLHFIDDGTNMDDMARRMHLHNGLLIECGMARFSRRSAQEWLTNTIELCEWETKTGKPILAGQSIAFDRSFIKHHMPKVEAMLSHRMYDVRTLALALEDAGAQDRIESDGKHRARSDVEASLRFARAHRNFLRHVLSDQGSV